MEKCESCGGEVDVKCSECGAKLCSECIDDHDCLKFLKRELFQPILQDGETYHKKSKLEITWKDKTILCVEKERIKKDL